VINIYSKSHLRLGIVPHFCNPSYSGVGDLEDTGLKLVGRKKLMIPISRNKPCVVVCAYNSSYEGTIDRSWPDKYEKPYSKTN
jgi:hypothetical protein